MGILSRLKGHKRHKKSQSKRKAKKKAKKKRYVKVKVTVYEVKYHTGKRTLTRRFSDLNEARRFAREAIMKGYDVESIRKRNIEREVEGVTRKELVMNNLGKALTRVAENAAEYYSQQYGSSTRSKKGKSKSKKKSKKRSKHKNTNYDPFNTNIFSW